MSNRPPASSSPPPAPTSPSESVAAPAEVGQVMGAAEFFITQVLFPLLMLLGLLLCLAGSCYFLGRLLSLWLELVA